MGNRVDPEQRRKRVFLSIGLVCLATAAVVAAGATCFDVLFGKELTYRYCPSRYASIEPVIPSQLSEQADAYRGPGPHHVHVDGPGDTDSTLFALPEKWVVPLDGGQYVFRTVQLVVCQYEYEVPDQEPSSCSYRDTSGNRYDFMTYPSRYAYRVYEATTGRLLSSFEVKGDMGSGDCVDSMLVAPEQATTDLAPPDLDALTRHLKPLVEGDAP